MAELADALASGCVTTVHLKFIAIERFDLLINVELLVKNFTSVLDLSRVKISNHYIADVAESADALASGCVTTVYLKFIVIERFDLLIYVELLVKKSTSVLDLSRVKISDHYMRMWRNRQMRWLRVTSRQCI